MQTTKQNQTNIKSGFLFKYFCSNLYFLFTYFRHIKSISKTNKKTANKNIPIGKNNIIIINQLVLLR